MTRKSAPRGWKSCRRLVVVGYGHWGKALSACFADAGYQIDVLENFADSEEWINKFANNCIVLLSCPFEFISSYVKKLSREKNCLAVINASKGIDRKSLQTFSGLSEALLKVPFASLSGPTFAEELQQQKATACVLAGHNQDFVEEISKRISNKYFRVYAHQDPIGVEVCGAVKNILAIACGISDGLENGENARAAILTRALPELMKIVTALGGKSATIFGLAGVGDLWLTACGGKSRNRRFGMLLGKAHAFDESLKIIGETVEGVYTLQQIEKIRKRYNLELPICKAVYEVVLKGKTASNVLQQLMGRALKFEESSAWKLR